jgi:hypothetical protein
MNGIKLYRQSRLPGLSIGPSEFDQAAVYATQLIVCKVTFTPTKNIDTKHT